MVAATMIRNRETKKANSTATVPAVSRRRRSVRKDRSRLDIIRRSRVHCTRATEAVPTLLPPMPAQGGKFGKSRELPLHPSAMTALGEYLRRGDRPRQLTLALLVSTAGTRLLYTNVQPTFRRLVCRVALKASCRPRLHDLRDGFAVRTILDGYRDGGDPGARLALLSTYLDHVDPGKTYWYLLAAPELLTLAGDRLERHVGGSR